MATLAPKLVIGGRGRKEAVVLAFGEYRRLLRRIEDLEDALKLDRAEQNSKALIPYDQVRRRLRRAGKL